MQIYSIEYALQQLMIHNCNSTIEHANEYARCYEQSCQLIVCLYLFIRCLRMIRRKYIALPLSPDNYRYAGFQLRMENLALVKYDCCQ